MAWLFRGSWLFMFAESEKTLGGWCETIGTVCGAGVDGTCSGAFVGATTISISGHQSGFLDSRDKNAMGLRVHGDRAEHRGRSDWSDRHGDE